MFRKLTCGFLNMQISFLWVYEALCRGILPIAFIWYWYRDMDMAQNHSDDYRLLIFIQYALFPLSLISDPESLEHPWKLKYMGLFGFSLGFAPCFITYVYILISIRIWQPVLDYVFRAVLLWFKVFGPNDGEQPPQLIMLLVDAFSRGVPPFEDPIYLLLGLCYLPTVIVFYILPLPSRLSSKYSRWFLKIYTSLDSLYAVSLQALRWVELPICKEAEVTLRHKTLPFEYDKQLSRFEIRLLVLAKRRLGRPPQVRLIRKRLTDVPELIACSYVWGEPSLSHAIEVKMGYQIMHMPVTRSLYHLLCREQSIAFEKTLWVDAVCINQADIVEKSVQVTIMRSIFSRTSSVHAHLDDSLGYSEIRAWIGFAQCEKQSNSLKVDKFRIGRSSDDLQFAQAVSNFFTVPWFSRAWILQEAVVAQRLVMQYRTTCIEWHEFLSLVEFVAVAQPNLSLINCHREKNDSKITEIAKQISRASMISQTYYDWSSKTNSLSLRTLLGRSHLTEATEPSDRIYSLLGLTNSNHSIQIDYTDSIKKTYACAAWSLMCEENSLRFMSAGDFFCPGPLLAEIPSWIGARSDDQEGVSKAWISTNQQGFFFREWGVRADSLRVESLDHYYLQPPGFELGSVDSIVPYVDLHGTFDHIQEPLQALLKRQWEHALSRWASPDKQSSSADIDQVRYAFWETLVLGRIDCQSRCVSPEDHSAMFRIIDKFLDITIGENDSQRFPPALDIEDVSVSQQGPGFMNDMLNFVSSEIISTLRGRVFGYSTRGALLLLPAATRKSDLLVYCCGASTPFVIRHEGDVLLDSTRRVYRFIGPFYIRNRHPEQLQNDIRTSPMKSFLLS